MLVMRLCAFKFLIFFCFLSNTVYGAEKPQLLLANTYQKDSQINFTNYWVSEKLDGVRAYWDGTKLLTRSGNIIHLPKILKNTLPITPLDGELWLGRNTFERINALIRSHSASDAEWGEVRYKIFDLPRHQGTFDERLKTLNALYKEHQNTFWSPIEHFKIENYAQLEMKLKKIEKLGAEGLMLHKANSLYLGTRTDDLLKVKNYQDDEAVVIAYTPGKGKYTGQVGALVVQMESGLKFNIGSGLSDEERLEPPAIGSTITFKHFGLTQNGVPRFASYLRIRIPVTSQNTNP